MDYLGYEDDGIEHVSLRFGFSDDPDLPGHWSTPALTACCR